MNQFSAPITTGKVRYPRENFEELQCRRDFDYVKK